MTGPSLGRLANAASFLLAAAVIVGALASALGAAVVVVVVAVAVVAGAGWTAWRLGRRSVVRAGR